MLPPDVRASCDERLTSTVTWSRYRGALYATVVLKATVALHHGRSVTPLPPQRVRWCDSPRASGALDYADESAPFSGGGAVLVHGFVYAREASEREPALARVIVGTDKPVVDKVIAAECRGKIPLAWEQALLTHENPAGVAHPVLVDPRDRTRAIGLGPVAQSWSPRVHVLAAPINVHDNILELPDRLDPKFFNPAPLDQQCPPFRGTEGIVLLNLSPKLPELRTWLPAVSVAGQLSVDGVLLPPLSFVLDTLSIDAEAAQAHLIWRAFTALPPNARFVDLQARLSGSFEELAPVSEAPRTEDAPQQQAASAPAAVPVRAPRVLPSEPRQLLRLDDARRAVTERAAAGASLEDLDLAGADLHGLDLSGRSLAHSKLDGADLRGARLVGSNLWAASLVAAELAGACFDSADLEAANLSKARAQKASFVRATLWHANLTKARLDGAVLDDADLSDCDARGVALIGAKLRRTKLNRAKLEQSLLLGADFQDASLDFATLGNSSLDDASFKGASLADAELVQCVADQANFRNARLARAKLTQTRFASASMNGADLSGANLERADLSQAQLAGAFLDHANASHAKLIQADLTGASLINTDLRGADLTGARLTKTDRSSANLEGAKLANVIE